MQSFWDWFLGEAGAAWIVGLLGLLVGLYSAFFRSQKSLQGRHVVCTPKDPGFSHLSLSRSAREWVKVYYVGKDQQDPTQIDTLSQVFIEIRLVSDTDALNDVELKFHVPRSRVLKVWWETAPGYLVEQSKLSFYPVEKPCSREDKPLTSYWEIRVSLAQLKSYDKFKEDLTLGILADGNLKDIEMPVQGSTGGPVDQVWTAKFVSFEDYQKERKKNKRRAQRLFLLRWTASLLMFIVGFLWLTFKLFGPFEIDWRLLVASSLLGFVVAGLLGHILQQLRFARARLLALDNCETGIFGGQENE